MKFQPNDSRLGCEQRVFSGGFPFLTSIDIFEIQILDLSIEESNMILVSGSCRLDPTATLKRLPPSVQQSSVTQGRIVM